VGFIQTVTAQDSLDNTIAFASNVFSVSNDGNAAFYTDAAYATTTDAYTLTSGIATIYVLDLTAQTITISAQDGEAKVGTSGSITISAGGIDRYQVMSSLEQVAGRGWEGGVIARDAYGNVATGATNTFTMSSSGSAVTFYTDSSYATSTATYSLSSGLASIFVKTTVAQTLTLTATDAGSKTGTSLAIEVLPAGGAYLEFTQQPSATATAGQAFAQQPQVTVRDAFGNAVTTDSETQITLARGAKGTDALQGTTTATAASGTASYAGLSYNKAETMNIQATAAQYPYRVGFLGLDISGAGAAHWFDDKYIVINSDNRYVGGGGDGWDAAESAETPIS